MSTESKRTINSSKRERSAASILATAILCLLITAGVTKDLQPVTFSALKTDTWQVYIARGSSVRALLPDARIQEGGELSHDRGRALILVDRSLLIVTDVEGKRLHSIKLPPGEYAHPSWMGENAAIVTAYTATASGESSRLLRVELETSRTEPLLTQTGILDFATVSPSGRYLAYSIGVTAALQRGGVRVFQQLWLMDLQTGMPRQLILNPARNVHPDWSPDSNTLAFASDVSGQFEIWTISVDGSGARQLTQGKGSKQWPRWSPDGKQLLYNQMDGGRQQLWTMDLTAGTPVRFMPFGSGAQVDLKDADW